MGRMRPTLILLFALGCDEATGPTPGAAFLPDASRRDGGSSPTDAEVADQNPQEVQGDGGVPATAAATYARLCAGCHGTVGEGGTGPTLTGLGGRDREALVERIDRTMPPTDPSLCTGPCAQAMADLILGTFATPPEACDPTGALPRRLRLLTRREYANSLKDLFFFDAVDCAPTTFRLEVGGRTTVHVAGSFNGWPGTLAAGGWPLTRAGDVWTLHRALPAGRHSYKFVLDERDWIPDPTNPLQEPDGFGGHNSVVEVPPCEAPPQPADFTQGIPPETRPEGFGFETHAASGRVTPVHLEAYLDNAERAARAALARRGAWLTCEDPACFVATVGRRIFRRPLTEAELTRYTTRARERGLEAALAGLLASPHFLYRSERGTPAGATFTLTGWERATALAYFLWGSTPDEALLDAAEAGTLDTPAGLVAQAERLLDDPRAHATLGTFAAQWLGIEGILTTPKSSDLQPFFGDEVRAALLAETRDFVADTVLTGQFADLLTAPSGEVAPALATLYGDHDAGRAGLLRHGALLATYAHSDQTSPIRRGLFVRRQLLCQALPPPPPNAGGVPDVDPSATTRERFRQHTDDAFCASCHQYIDDLGFGFEAFDALGRHREVEGGLPVDSTGNMNDLEGLGQDTQAPFNDLATLGALLAQSDSAPACFATQVRRFALGSEEGPADRCAVEALRQAFVGGDGDLRALLLAVVAAPEFVTRVEEAR